MKLLLRTFCLIIFSLFLTLLIFRLNNINYKINEVHNSSYLAIEEGMNKEMKYLKGDLNYLNLQEEIEKSFNTLVSKPNNYQLNIKADEEKGIVKFKVKCLSSKMIKDINLINIIEHLVDKKETEGLDRFNVDKFLRATRSDNVLYFKEFVEPTLLKSFYIDIEAFTTSNGESIYNRYEPEMTITIVDEFDGVINYKKAPVVGKDTLKEVNFDSDNYDFEELYVKSVKLEMKGISKNVAPKAELLRIGSTGKNYFEYEGESRETHTIYSRYIDGDYIAPSNSLWLENEYQEILKEYLK